MYMNEIMNKVFVPHSNCFGFESIEKKIKPRMGIQTRKNMHNDKSYFE